MNQPTRRPLSVFLKNLILLTLLTAILGAVQAQMAGAETAFTPRPPGAPAPQPPNAPLLDPPNDPPAQGTSNLLYSAFLGGSGNDCFPNCAIAVDAGGSVYVVGHTTSTDFSGFSGAPQPANQRGDIFVVKVAPDGTGFEYATFLGGSKSDYATAAAVDSSGSLYVVGYTSSPDFPVTGGAAYNGGFSDAFVAKFKADGSGLVYATFLGGDNTDRAYGLAVDRNGSAYVTGETRSADFPTTPNALQSVHSGDSDAFVLKLSPDGQELVYATLLGGAGGDESQAIAVDLLGQAYLTGQTTSGDFPVTNAAFATEPAGPATRSVATPVAPPVSPVATPTVSGTNEGTNDSGQASPLVPLTKGVKTGRGDAFVVKLSPKGNRLIYATFLGGSSVDQGKGIAVDAEGRAYVVGSTLSPDFPVTENVFDSTHNKSYDVFVARLNAAGSNLDYATYLGGNGSDRGYAIVVDNAGSAFVTGATYSQNFPATKSTFDPTYNYGYADAFLVKLKPDGSGLDYATFLGGSEPDNGASLAIDGEGSIYLAGGTLSPTFPATVGGFDPEYNGDWDGFVTKVVFSGQKGTSMISGVIRDQQGKPVPGVVVSAGGHGSVATDANGVYVLIGLNPGTYTLTPIKPGHTFSPVRRTVNVPTDQALLVFVGVPQGDPPEPFLDLPLDYDNSVSAFVQALQDTDGHGWVTSWFDHAYPDYKKNQRLTLGDGISRAKDGYNLNLGCYERHCYDGHDGIDLIYRDFRPGLTRFQGVPVLAAADGQVVIARSGCVVGDRWCGGGLGNQILLDHHNGYYTLYGHLAGLKIKKGQTVTQGDPIGVMGNTGNAFGAHLHFGVYRDDGNGEWDGAEVDKQVDPFGWRGNQADPWVVDRQGPTSAYLWRRPLAQEKGFAGAQGVIFNDSTNSIGVTVPANALSGQASMELFRGSVPNATRGNRSLGHSFWLRVLEWLPGNSAVANASGAVRPEDALAQPIALNVSYGANEVSHLNLDKLQLNRWDKAARAWQPMPSTVDPKARIVTAQTKSFGQFDLQAPLICPSDFVEPDDNYFSAHQVTADEPVSRLFDTAEDEDWFYFVASQSARFTIETSQLGPNVDTKLEIYDLSDGTLLTGDDNSGPGAASRLEWKPPRNGTFFIRVLPAKDSASGCNASYSLSITYELNQLYLPLVLKN